MKVPSGIVVVLLAVSMSVAQAGTEKNSLQVKVKDVAGKPAAGVSLLLQGPNVKDAGKQMVSDSAGRAVFQNVVPGTYKISAFEDRTPSAAATMTQVGSNGSTTVTLGLVKMVKSSNQAKKKKRYVYVAAETGSHIGGGRWIEVDDDSAGASANPLEKQSAQTLNQPHSFDMRAWQGPSQ